MADHPLTYYDLFEVEYDATHEEIYQAYLRMLEKVAHDAEKRQQVKTGWAILGSERSRAEYDERNEIASLLAARQLRRRPPPTLVGPTGGTAPKTVVLPPVDPGAPKTIVLPPADPAASNTLVKGSSGSAGAEKEPEPPSPSIVVSLTVLPPAGQKWSRQLSLGETSVGRRSASSAPVSDIQLEDPDRFISRRHAALVVTADSCFVRDENSANGTSVNGHQIPRGKSSVLVDGDRIGIEGYVLVVTIRPVGERVG